MSLAGAMPTGSAAVMDWDDWDVFRVLEEHVAMDAIDGFVAISQHEVLPGWLTHFEVVIWGSQRRRSCGSTMPTSLPSCSVTGINPTESGTSLRAQREARRPRGER